MSEITYGGRDHSKTHNLCSSRAMHISMDCAATAHITQVIELWADNGKFFIRSINGQPVNVEATVKKIGNCITISPADILSAIKTIVVHSEYDPAAPALPRVPEPAYLGIPQMPKRRDRDHQQERLRAKFHGRKK